MTAQTAGQAACPAAARSQPAEVRTEAPLLLAVLALLVLGQAAPPGWRTPIAVGIIAVLGVPHGALDGEVARPVLRPRFGRAWFAAFSLPYLALSAAVLLAWRLAPGPTLAGFFAASVWHFGEEDAGPQPLAAIARGGLPVALPVLLHPQATAAFLGTISLAPAPVLPAWLLAAAFAWCAPALLWLARAAGRRDWPGLADAALVAALFAALPPLAAFTAYFVGLHAPRHVHALAAGGAAPRLAGSGVPILRALPLTALTVLIAAALWPWFPGAPPARALALTFQLLAALTLPHMLLPSALGLLARPSQARA